MKLVVTGAAGFIGCNIIRHLNAAGADEIIAVDDLTMGDKFGNLVDLRLADYFDRGDFLARFDRGAFGKVDAFFHQGACSDTMEQDGRYMLENNYRYAKDALDVCLRSGTRFIYASSAAVYGGSGQFSPTPYNERPLNVYGYSKLLFDQVVRLVLPAAETQVAGLRYFNVYGPGETHKGRMASVAFHFFHQFRKDGRVRLFGRYNGYERGRQLRDFIHVDDVARVNLWLLDHPEVRGIYNLGTGAARSFNDVAHAVVNAVRDAEGLPTLTLEEQVDLGLVGYVDFPEALKGKYQSFTEADMGELRRANYGEPFLTLEEGISRYVRALLDRDG